jgi:hypothetical protein
MLTPADARRRAAMNIIVHRAALSKRAAHSEYLDSDMVHLVRLRRFFQPAVGAGLSHTVSCRNWKMTGVGPTIWLIGQERPRSLVPF